MFALGTDGFVVAGVLPEIARSLHVGIGAAAQMTTIYAITFALLAPVIAAFGAHVPRKHLLLAGLSIFVIANLGTAIAPTFAIALATRALAGLGAAIFSPTATGSASVIVPPERRGFALAAVITGMTVSTAIGSPIGTIIGGLVDWRWTMVFVAALAAVSWIGVFALLSHIPMLPAISLAKRLAPLADVRVGLTLTTSFLFFTGIYTIYTYFAVVFDRATGGDTTLLGGLLVLWGLAGIASNLLGGRLIDVVGNHKVLTTMLAFVLVDFILLQWTSAHVWTAILAVVFWGGFGWGTVVPLQHRLVGISPPIAPLLLGLNNSAIFFGTTAAGLMGAVGIQVLGVRNLGFIGAGFVALAMIMSELAARKIATFKQKAAVSQSVNFGSANPVEQPEA